MRAGGWMSNEQFPRLAADVNGDGRADIVAFGVHGTFVSLSTGTGFDPPALWIRNYGVAAGGWVSQNRYPRTLGDVDGDGLADIVAFGERGVFVSLSTGSGFAPPALWVRSFGQVSGWSSQDVYPRLMGDVNGDGLADIVAFANSGVYVALSNGHGFDRAIFALQDFGVGAAAGLWTSQNLYPRMLADVNGDGWADIVGFGKLGCYVAESAGIGFSPKVLSYPNFGFAAGSWVSQDRYPRFMANVNGDGKADIVGFGQWGAFVSLYDR
jgi:hypothetical protein